MNNCKGCLFAALALLLVTILIGGLSVLRVGHFLASVDPLTPADVLVVLGGGHPDRARHAEALFEQGYAPLVLFSGGTLQSTGLACSSTELGLEAAQALGLPAGAIMIAGESQSTFTEAVNLSHLAQEHAWDSLIVVTDLFHARRAARTFRTLLPGVAIHVSAAPSPRFDPARWWATEEGLVTVFNEVLKLGYYWVRHGIAPF